jgi:DNA-binding CsgD family transcriptional regulator
MRTGKIADKTILELYRKGFTDREIAERLGMSPSAVNYRRGKLGLPSHVPQDGTTDELIRALNADGMTDRDIAARLGISQSSVNYRRARQGLVSNFIRSVVSDDDFLDLYHQGFTDKEAAAALGVTPAAIGHTPEAIADILRISRAAAWQVCDVLIPHVRRDTDIGQGTG